MSASGNFEYIKPLYTICELLGVAPPYSFKDEDVKPISSLYKGYVIVQLGLITFLFVHSWYGRSAVLYNGIASEDTIEFTDKLANTALYIFGIFTLIICTFYKGAELKKFFNKAMKLSKVVKIKCLTRQRFNWQLIIFNIYLLILIAFDAVVWMNSVGWRIYQFYLGRTYQYYVYDIIFYLLLHLVLMIKFLFKSLNDCLESILKNLLFCEGDNINLMYILSEFKARSRPSTQHTPQDLKNIRIYYNEICDLIDLFNTNFGFLILAGILVIISMILSQIDIFLVFTSEKYGTKLAGSAYGSELTALVLSWIITFMGLALIMAYACSEANSEREKISVRCIYWLNHLPAMPKSDYQMMIKEELLLLSQQCSQRQPKFSAAGFFQVDFTLFAFIIGNITSYVIVMIQFIK